MAFTETTLSNTLAIVNLRFVETEMAAEIVPHYVKTALRAQIREVFDDRGGPAPGP